MTLVQALALLTALIVVGKLLIVWRNPKLWFNESTSRVWKAPLVLTIVSFIIAAGTLAILLQELTIVQIWAALMFSMALIMLGLAPFSKYMLEAETKWFTQTNTLRLGWFAVLVWGGLSIWVLVTLGLQMFA